MREVVEGLEKAARSRSRERIIRQFINYFKRFLTPENLKEAISRNIDLTSLIYDTYGLTSPDVLPIFRTVMRMYWDEFEEVVTNVPRLFKALMMNPGCKGILDTPQGINYLNEQCEKIYKYTYHLVWET